MLLALALATAPPDDIVVTGQRAPTASEISQSIRTVTAVSVDNQLARWNAPLCVRVNGVAEPVAAIVRAKIDAEARAAGAKVANTGCRTNVVVSFVRDAAGVVATMSRRQPGLLGKLPPADRRALAAPDLPVRWWYGYDTRGSDGRVIGGASSALGANMSAGDGVVLPGRVSETNRASLTATELRVDVVATTVLVDVDRATGTRLSAVAAYVARVVVAPTRIVRPKDAEPTVPTVLTLFDSGDPRPADLSAFDHAYLASLYRLPVDRRASSQRAALAAGIAKRLQADAR